MGYLDATFILIKKNCLLSFRDSAALLITLSAAFFSMLVLYFSQLSINSGDGFNPEAFENRDPGSYRISTIPRCVPGAHSDCFTIAYVPAANTQVTSWVRSVASASDIPINEVKAFNTDDELNQFLVNFPNRTQAAYIFDEDSIAQALNSNVVFTVQYNETEQFEFPLGSTEFHTQVVLPAMIHQMNLVMMPQLSNKTVDVSLNASVFPHPDLIEANSSVGLDAFGQYGDVLTFATFFLAFVFFLHRIVQEKERGLRDAMKLAGQTQSQHYISWCLPYFVVNLLLTFLIILWGRIFGFKVFSNTAFIVYFLTMFIFTLSLIAWTMLLATVTSKSTSVSVVAFNIFIFGYLLASIGSIVYATNVEGDPIVGENVLLLRQLFAIFPSTMYVKAIRDISIASLIGSGLSFDKIAEYPLVFSVRECWLWMLGSTVVTFILSLYLDNVLPSEHGVPISPLYPFQPSYWFPQSVDNFKADSFSSDDENSSDSEDNHLPLTSTLQYDPNTEDVDVAAEKQAVASGSRDTAALVIKNFGKKFGSNQAVDDVSFSVKRNTAFALLGHNGAGKSTLFKMLTTTLRPSAGDAYIYGLSVRRDRTAVRKLLGVCPQFDMYWDMLTGAEHIEVFAALKGMSKVERTAEIERRMEDVDLTPKANVFAGQYSGGMQRRLSVALSLTGDPKIILLDECTSGADPLVRRDLWAAIQRAKEGRVIFMITHSIAEAQHIAGHNLIGIMAQGKLRVLGNAMHLKTKFGAGYAIVVVLNDGSFADPLGEAISAACGGEEIRVTSTVGENQEILATYALPRTLTESQVLIAVETIESERHIFGVRDYSINSTTLGEVFTSITSLSEDVAEEGDESEPTE